MASVPKKSAYDQLLKLIILGDSSVGKSSILMMYTKNEFTSKTNTTIGLDFVFKKIMVN